MSENVADTTCRQLILSAGGSLVNPFPRLGSGEANRMTAISGRRCGASLLSSDPVGSLLKTCLTSETFTSTRFYLTWKVWATPRGRSIFRLSHSVPPTSGIDCSLWPTPTVGDSKNARNATANRKKIPPTGIHKGYTLVDAVTLWPTPTARDCWPRGPSEAKRRSPALNHKATGGQPGKLNPASVEWLMGFPIGWTEFACSATP